MNDSDGWQREWKRVVAQWLSERAELFILSDVAHSGGPPSYYFARTIEDVADLQNQRLSGELLVFRAQQFGLRGIVTDKFIHAVAKKFAPNESWKVFPLAFYPAEVELLGGGDTWDELYRDLLLIRGADVCAGPDPILTDAQWISAHPEQVLRIPLRGKPAT